MKQLLEYKWSIVALAGLGAGLLLSKGGAASLLPLVKVIVPVVLVIFLLKVTTKKLRATASNFVAKNMSQMAQQMNQQAGGGPFAGFGQQQGKKVIDLCPKCGSYKQAGHSC